MPLYANGVFYDYGDRVIVNGRRCASGYANGRFWSLIGSGQTPVTPPPVGPPSPPTIFNGIVMPDVSRQAFAPDYLDSLGRYFTASANTDSITYTATSTQGYVTVDVSNGLRLSFGYPGVTAGQATVEVTATATNAGGSASATASFTVYVTLNNMVIIPVDDIRPPVPAGNPGGYAFATTTTLALVGGAGIDNPTWAQIADLQTATSGDDSNGPVTVIGLNQVDADGNNRSDDVEAFFTSPTITNGEMQWRRSATETVTWVGSVAALLPPGGADRINFGVVQEGALVAVTPTFGTGINSASTTTGPGDGLAYIVLRKP